MTLSTVHPFLPMLLDPCYAWCELAVHGRKNLPWPAPLPCQVAMCSFTKEPCGTCGKFKGFVR